MKNQILINALVELGLYEVDYDKEYEDDPVVMSIKDSSGKIRPIKNPDLSDEEINTTLAAESTLYLKSINSKMTFFTVLIILSICASIFMVFN